MMIAYHTIAITDLPWCESYGQFLNVSKLSNKIHDMNSNEVYELTGFVIHMLEYIVICKDYGLFAKRIINHQVPLKLRENHLGCAARCRH